MEKDAVRSSRELARRAGPPTVHHDRVERVVGREGAREGEPQLGETAGGIGHGPRRYKSSDGRRVPLAPAK